MGTILRILSYGLAVIAGAAATIFIRNKNQENDPDNCKVFLAFSRKKLIDKMNKDIKDREERTSAENHAKRQQELENMDWDNKGGMCSI